MFNRKKKIEAEIDEDIYEDEISVEIIDPLYDEIKVPSKREMKKDRKIKNKQLKKEKPISEAPIKKRKTRGKSEEKIKEKNEVVEPVFNFEWADNEVCQLKQMKLEEKKVIPKEVEEPKIPQESIKKELDEYFLKNNSDLFIKEGSKKKAKKSKRARLRSYYKYKGNQFHSPSELLEFLDKNPKKLEKIAATIVDDELFFKWLGKNSHQFIESVKDFRTFKKKIEE